MRYAIHSQGTLFFSRFSLSRCACGDADVDAWTRTSNKVYTPSTDCMECTFVVKLLITKHCNYWKYSKNSDCTAISRCSHCNATVNATATIHRVHCAVYVFRCTSSERRDGKNENRQCDTHTQTRTHKHTFVASSSELAFRRAEDKWVKSLSILPFLFFFSRYFPFLLSSVWAWYCKWRPNDATIR